MVTYGSLVYIFCFLTVLGAAQDLYDTEGYSNDNPFNDEPKLEKMRVKSGTPITLKCAHHNHVVWEYKECDVAYKGVICNPQDLTSRNSRENNTWRRSSNTRRFQISSLQKNNSGIYRCVEKGIVRKSVIIEVVGSDGYTGSKPYVQSLLTSNITNQLNMEFTIQCNVTSIIPPTIIWFKKCYGSKCDIEYEKICYCHLNITTSYYNIGNTYINKINIFNAREIDSGLYACLAVTEYGKDHKNVTINVPDTEGHWKNSNSFPLLFLIPLALIVVPLLIWSCYFKRKEKPPSVLASGQQQQALIKASRSRATRTVV